MQLVPFYHVLNSLLMSGWQVVQEKDGLRARLSGALKGGYGIQIKDAILCNLTAQNVLAPRISMQHVDVIPRMRLAKRL